MPEEKDLMTKPLKRFLAMSESEQLLFMVGRRTGIFTNLKDITDSYLLPHAPKAVVANGVTPDNVDDFTAEMMQRFI